MLHELDSSKLAGSAATVIREVELRFTEEKGSGFKTNLRVAAWRGGRETTVVIAPAIGSLWIPGCLRKGIGLDAPSGTITLRRNGPRPLKRYRRITVTGPTISWTLSGTVLVAQLRDQESGRVLWRHAPGVDVIDTEMSDEALCVLGVLLYCHVIAALCLVPALSR